VRHESEKLGYNGNMSKTGNVLAQNLKLK